MICYSMTRNKHYRDGMEITEAEYQAAAAEIREQAAWVEKLCKGTAAAEDVPERWREDIVRRAAERMAEAEDDALSPEEAMEILLGGAV